MKIGIDISQIVYEGTGVATYTSQLVKSLVKVDTKNEYIFFASSLRRQDKFIGLGAKIFPFPPTALDFFWNRLHTLPIEQLLGKIDVFHSSDWTQPPSKAKKVTTIHDLVVYTHPEFSHPIIIDTQKRRLEWVKKECDLIIADSDATKRDIIELLKIPAEKIRTIYLAAGSEYVDYDFKNLGLVKEKYKLDKPYILAVGTNEPRKNQNRLALAFKQLNLKDYDLVVVGKYGWGDQELLKNVRSLGFVPQEDLPAIYAGASLFVYPSLYEGFGVPILEAMSVGCPVVTSNVSSLPEVGGDAALYFDPLNIDDIASKIITALDSKGLKEKSLAQSKKFSWEKTASNTLKVYEELV